VRDFASSDDPAVQAQLDRLAALSLPQGRFGLETIRALLRRLGDPQHRIPPTFHVAGTNGKGSTCAYLRAMLEAEGLTVHAATKPHLVRYNERIRLAGALIEDAHLAELLKQVLDLGTDLSPSFFEVTTAATFLAFAEVPADACVIEVGLGGRFDATNVLEAPAACGIASLGIDHEAFLLRPEDGTPVEPLARIAFEKASIARPGAPLVTQGYAAHIAGEIARTGAAHGARMCVRGHDWNAKIGTTIAYRDAQGELALPLPALPGSHQADNAALAVAMLRHQDRVAVSPSAMARGISAARWPARLQLLEDGPLTALVPGRKVWLDGGHNPDAGEAIARFFGVSGNARASTNSARAGLGSGPTQPEPVEAYPEFARSGSAPTPARRIHLIVGMLANKDASAIVRPLRAALASLSAVPVPGHDSHAAGAYPAELKPAAFPDVATALCTLPPGGEVLIAGSLYLAGEVLTRNEQIPD
jgi:dihydrofolate synthase/folylpolyglutamate synthase